MYPQIQWSSSFPLLNGHKWDYPSIMLVSCIPLTPPIPKYPRVSNAPINNTLLYLPYLEGINIHLPAILGSPGYQGFDTPPHQRSAGIVKRARKLRLRCFGKRTAGWSAPNLKWPRWVVHAIILRSVYVYIYMYTRIYCRYIQNSYRCMYIVHCTCAHI